MAFPLLSIIIPTHGRPQFLPRAIDSALRAAPDGDVEVIVVPNGPDESWKAAAERYRKDSRVQWHAISTPHANAARNHGMKQATGTYIRFLDDDDYLYPQAACEQLTALISKAADLSFANIDSIEDTGSSIKTLNQINTDDYVTAALSPAHLTQPTAFAYRRSLIQSLAWNPSVMKRQDVYWVMSLCKKQEIKSVRFDKVVGAWVQHELPRVSKGHHRSTVSTETAKHIIELVESLSEQGRLTESRSQAASDHLWQCIHHGIMYAPKHWIGIATYAQSLAPGRHPGTRMYQSKLIGRLNPLFVELAIIPLRWIRVLLGHEYSV